MSSQRRAQNAESGQSDRGGGNRGFSRRNILATVGGGSIAGLAGCSGQGDDSEATPVSDGTAGTDTTTGGGGSGGVADDVYNSFYTANPPEDLYFNPFGPTAAGMGLQHWAMLFTGIAMYDVLNPEQAILAVLGDHPLHTDPIEDGTATIKIREDHTWHDGDSYTAQDFAAGRQMQLNIAKSAGSEEGIPYSAVRVVDDYTVEVDMRDPSVPHRTWWDTMYGANLHHSCCTIGNGPMWVQHKEWEDWLERYADASTQDEMQSITQELQEVRRPFEETVGHGPFKIKEISGQTVVYEPFEEWQGLIAYNWPEETGVGDMERIGRETHETWLENDMTAELTFYAERSVQAQAAMSGELDYVRLQSESQGQQLIDERDWELTPLIGRVYSSGTVGGYYVNFNYAPLAKRKVRQALLYLMPQKQLARIGFQNTFETSRMSPEPIPVVTGLSWAGAKNWLDTDAIQENWTTYDVENSNTEKATSLLQEAGLSREDGAWYTESGDRFTLDIKQNNDTAVEVSRALKSAFESFGIKSNFTAVNPDTSQNDLNNGEYDLFMYFDEGGPNWPGIPFRDDAFMGQDYPWGGTQNRQVGHPDEWEVPSTIGDPDSELETVDVVPKIQKLNQADNDHEALTRELAWVVNQNLPNLTYLNGEFQPSQDQRRTVGQLYNANNWVATTREEYYANYIAGATGNPGYPHSRHHYGSFRPQTQ